MTAWRNQKGASAVEFALILPLLVVLLFGIVEFGLLMYNTQVITNASREGARAGIVFSPRPNTTAIENVVKAYANSRLVTFGTQKEPSTTLPNGSCSAFGDDLIVNVSYPYRFLVFQRLVGLLGSGTMTDSITLSAQTVMKCE